MGRLKLEMDGPGDSDDGRVVGGGCDDSHSSVGGGYAMDFWPLLI
jgi:hypothetical protein